ncbi:unnamed protein product [Prunus armeniaca]
MTRKGTKANAIQLQLQVKKNQRMCKSNSTGELSPRLGWGNDVPARSPSPGWEWDPRRRAGPQASLARAQAPRLG